MATRPPAPERSLRADARRNRERILDAAREAFADEGSSAQIDAIARRAAVGVGTVYRHFPTKEALIEELMAEKFRAFTENAREALAIDDPWEAFTGLLRRNAALMAADAALRDELARSGAVIEVDAEETVELRAIGSQLIERAQHAGAAREDLTIDDIPMLMAGLCSSMAVPGCDWRRHLDLLIDGMRAQRG
jgi:AcrR family transcriptional regulator